MNSTIVPVNQARRHLGQLVEEVFYRDKSFLFTRSKRPMAVLIGKSLFAQMVKVIEKYDHGLADTLAIMSNPELQAVLEEDEHNADQAVPFDESLLDEKE